MLNRKAIMHIDNLHPWQPISFATSQHEWALMWAYPIHSFHLGIFLVVSFFPRMWKDGIVHALRVHGVKLDLIINRHPRQRSL